MTTGIATQVSIWENLVSDRIDKPELKDKGFLSMHKIKDLANHLIKDFAILCRNMNQEVGMLSGGNMQKSGCSKGIICES